jgi:TPR repeat protein
MYDNGEGVAEDDTEAVKWWRLAAEQGDAVAQSNLGLKYAQGEGVSEDYAEAIKWWRLSAEQGNTLAQNGLGVLYETGEGVRQDNIKAHMWFNIASSIGDKDAVYWKTERENLMASADIFEAQGMALKCISSNYKNCGF